MAPTSLRARNIVNYRSTNKPIYELFISLLLAFLGIAPICFAAVPIIGAPDFSPSRVEWGRPTVVVAQSAVELPPKALPSLALTLEQIDNNGRVISNLGTLHDDGSAPDFKAGDRIFTRELTLNPSALGLIQLRVS